MEIIDSKEAYKAPKAKVAELSMRGILCLSDPALTDWGNGSDSEEDMD